MSVKLTPALAALGLVCGAAVAFAYAHYSTGPLPGKTGAFAVGAHAEEVACNECHITDVDGTPVPNLNLPGGQVRILDMPHMYTPGRTYTLRVQLASDSTALTPFMQRWGFQLTAARASDGAGAGTFSVRDPDSVQVVHLNAGPSSDRWYVEHNMLGTHDGEAGPVEWSFDWQAPATSEGTVYFFVAGNAANGSEEPSGDFIYTYADSMVDTTTAARPSSWGALKVRRR